MKKLFVVPIIMIYLVCASITFSHAADYRVYTEIGGMGLHEKGISEGHKSYYLLGTSISTENIRAKVTGGIEGFILGEAEDEDPELLKWGTGIYGEYLYKWTKFMHPYLGARFDYWERGSNQKYQDAIQETDFTFASATGGIKFNCGLVYLNVGTIIPFWTTTQSGNFGADVGIGISNGEFSIGYHYKEVVFSNHHFEHGDDDLKFTFSGVELSYKF